MPYKDKICGIYSITTPNGSKYVGSSHNIKLRWSEHKSRLRHQKQHSVRLQNAWNKHNGNLAFEIILVCNSEDLEREEQDAINRLNAELNTTQYVGNVWCNPKTRAKLNVVHSSDEWSKARSIIAKKLAERRGLRVDCSDGNSYKNLHEAGKAYGVNPSAIAHLIKTQRSGKIGFRFKRSTDDWLEVIPASQQRKITMIANGKHDKSVIRKQDKRTLGKAKSL